MMLGDVKRGSLEVVYAACKVALERYKSKPVTFVEA